MKLPSPAITKPMIVSGVFEIMKISLSVAFYALLARHSLPSVFAGYVLIRKAASWFSPIISFGTYQGLSYYLPAAEDDFAKEQIITSSFFLVVVSLMATVIILSIFPEATLSIFFGVGKAGSWFAPLLSVLLSSMIYQYVISVKRGMLKLFSVNIYNFLIIGLVPFCVILLSPHANLRRLVLTISAVNILVLIFPLMQIRSHVTFNFLSVIKGIKTIWRYSLSRVPSDLLLMTMLTVWLVIAAHFFDYQFVAYVSVALALLGALSAVVVPFEMVLLPSMRKVASSLNEDVASSRLVIGTIQCSYDLAIYISLHVAVLAPFIVRWWLADGEYASAALTIRMMSPVLFGYILCMSLRSLVDEMSPKPINSYLTGTSLLISLGMFAVGRFVFNLTSLAWLCLSCSAGFAFLGISAVYVLKAYHRLSLSIGKLLLPMLYSIASSGIILLLMTLKLSLMTLMPNEYAYFVFIVSSEIILFAVYTLFMARNGSAWACRIVDLLSMKLMQRRRECGIGIG